MDFIKGKLTKEIFMGDYGYLVGLFKVSDSNIDELINKSVTITGYFNNLNKNDTYILRGKWILNEKYGYQFKCETYERVEPSSEDEIYNFLCSSFVKGCGEVTAKKIVDKYGSDSIKKILDNKDILKELNISTRTINSIYKSLKEYYSSNELIMYLNSLGFNPREITQIINIYGENTKDIISNDLYSLVDFIDFKKLDQVYFMLYSETNDMRIHACIIETIKEICFSTGNTYTDIDSIISYLNSHFNIDISDNYSKYINDLVIGKYIYIINDNRYYLNTYYLDELYIATSLIKINNRSKNKINKFDELIKNLERDYQIDYDKEQENAIKSALTNNITIITGGPGTGKTTIINGILRMYKYINKLSNTVMEKNVCLLAPTGRAAKRMSDACNFPSSTIHRLLKWNLDTKEFGVNEYNTVNYDLIIIDEVSMVDTELFASLLKGINLNVHLVLVGDDSQLPSVSPGNILRDLIDSDIFKHVKLNKIYRQSNNSYIPILAKEIKDKKITNKLLEKHDDYNFLECSSKDIHKIIQKVISMSLDKGLDEMNVEILAPMYYGINGIDNLNSILQDLFNPSSPNLNEVKIGNVIYRENDKVINLVNNIDNNIFNGDIGYIVNIDSKSNEEFMSIDYYGNIVNLKREDINTIKHAYVMSIHKAQGSEFDNVIMIITNDYKRMLYNRLLYTGVSRAKKSLVIIGESDAFKYAVNNNYAQDRHTGLKDFLIEISNN